jgi:colicin import membrane protein
MSESARDRWLSIGMSVLLHGTLIALLAVGIWHFRHPTPPETLSIHATVVDAKTLKGVGIAPKPTPKPAAAPPQTVPPPPAPPVQGPPTPSPAEQAMRQQAAQEEAQHEAAAKRELLEREQAKQAQEQAAAAAQARKAAAAHAAKLAEEKKQAQARKKAEAAKLAAQKKQALERKLAEEKKLAEQKKIAEEKKLAAERAAAARAARVAELQQSLKEDEQAAAASGALASWTSEVTSRIQDAWIKPPSAHKGIECVLNVSLISGGAVTGVSIGQCNGDDAVRQSIQTAVYNASPLPPPPNGIPFPHQLIITFKPNT